ncbi:chromosomal replication initiator protein DnaA [Aquisediminimonas sediminicola]|uniref:chromosomal replication initiator protein DnaA n=1 Tax=Alteraquisediminimonas sediminicola TaxID=2676787 RepID=UPI001C8EFACE|nr:chromosomal replication initiator protein DnaA [Aquisediminimonas sediminicola]
MSALGNAPFIPAVDPLVDAWEAIRLGLRRDVGARTYDHWLKPVQLVDYDPDDQAVVLGLTSRFMADWVANNFGDRLKLAWRSIMPEVRDVRFIAGEMSNETVMSDGLAADSATARDVVADVATDDAAAGGAIPNAGPIAGSPLDPRFTFDNFVCGKANELAFNAARMFAAPGAPGFNPLFLHGGTGLGKTHLMHAIGHAWRTHRPDARVIYMSAEKFMYEFVASMRARDTFSFKERLRSADVLMIDDVQFIAGKDSTQEEFFHTMNEIIAAGKRLVITADRSPQDLERIESRILSRLSGGLVADVNPADFELRLNIIIRKLETMPQTQMPLPVVEFLARRITSNIRELEGAVNRVAAYAMLQSREIDLEFAQDTLADVLRANQRRISIDEIQRRVSEHFRIRQAEMTSARRSRDVARPRQIAMYLAKQLTPRSLPEIGRRFGGRDHTTVIHAVRQIEKLRAADADIDQEVRLLIRQLEG